MVVYFRYMIILAITSSAWSYIAVRRTGWLDRVVQYYKREFYKDVGKMPPIQIKAELRPMPADYKRDESWTYEKVVRLLVMLKESPHTRRLYRALRRDLLSDTRRFSKKDSYKWFPKISEDNYYDDFEKLSSSDENEEPVIVKDKLVLMIANPVESKLPSRIEVGELKEILLARAIKNRYMPTAPTITKSVEYKAIEKKVSDYAGDDNVNDGGGDDEGGKDENGENKGVKDGGDNKEDGGNGNDKGDGGDKDAGDKGGDKGGEKEGGGEDAGGDKKAGDDGGADKVGDKEGGDDGAGRAGDGRTRGSGRTRNGDIIARGIKTKDHYDWLDSLHNKYPFRKHKGGRFIRNKGLRGGARPRPAHRASRLSRKKRLPI